MYIFAALITLAIQFTDLKIYDVKLGDLLSLALIVYFFAISRKRPRQKLFKHLLYAFTFTFITSYIALLWVDVSPSPSSSPLKAEGVVTLSRYIQYVGCVFFAWTIHAELKAMGIQNQAKFMLAIDSQMFFWGCVFMGFWILALLGVENPFVYGPNRLRGGYIEGGPLGSMFSFFFIFRVLLIGFSMRWLFLLSALLMASQSKAGVLFLFVSFALLYLPLTRKARGLRLVLPIALMALLMGGNLMFDFSERMELYRKNVSTPEEDLRNRTDDKAFIMGRIAASYIAPRMFKDNLAIGVGMGNYSLARNNFVYRGPFPYVDDWDLSGLGGLINYVLEGGLIGLVVLLLPFARYILKQKPESRRIAMPVILIFLLTQVFGTQLYFQFIWLPLAAMTALKPYMWSITLTRKSNWQTTPYFGGDDITSSGMASSKNVLDLVALET